MYGERIIAPNLAARNIFALHAFYNSDGTPLVVTEDQAALRAELGLVMKDKMKRKRKDSGGGGDESQPPGDGGGGGEGAPGRGNSRRGGGGRETGRAQGAGRGSGSQGSSYGDGGRGGGAPKEQKKQKSELHSDELDICALRLTGPGPSLQRRRALRP